MTTHKKKIVAFLVMAALVSSALVVCSARPTTEESEKPSADNWSSQFANNRNLSEQSGANFAWEFLKTMLAVLLVVVLGVAAIYISKKLGAKISNLPGKEIRITETVHLGPRKAVHLLRIGNRQLLIGSTNESITMLAEVTSAAKGDEGHLRPPQASADTDLSRQQGAGIF
jgi:flagellar biosynthetic protein FliO